MNFNFLLDPLPKEYDGYLIKWQFWNGILISNCLGDSELFENSERGQIERIYTAFNLLFGKGIPPFDKALEGLSGFFLAEEQNKMTMKTLSNIFRSMTITKGFSAVLW